MARLNSLRRATSRTARRGSIPPLPGGTLNPYTTGRRKVRDSSYIDDGYQTLRRRTLNRRTMSTFLLHPRTRLGDGALAEPSHSHGFSADQVAKAASDLALSGCCSKRDAATGVVPLVMIDCREWTLILPAENPAGDRPGFFIDAVRSRHLGDDLFIPPRPQE